MGQIPDEYNPWMTWVLWERMGATLCYSLYPPAIFGPQQVKYRNMFMADWFTAVGELFKPPPTNKLTANLGQMPCALTIGAIQFKIIK